MKSQKKRGYIMNELSNRAALEAVHPVGIPDNQKHLTDEHFLPICDKLGYRFAYNQLDNTVELNGEQLTSTGRSIVRNEIHEKTGLYLSAHTFKHLTNVIASNNRYIPIKQYHAGKTIDFSNRTVEILEAHPLLHDGGYGYGSHKTLPFDEWRGDLLTDDSLIEVDQLCDWIDCCLSPGKTINYRHTSYGLKHIAERETGYVTNGQFILAALIMGYRMGKPNYNPSFNMNESGIQRASKRGVRLYQLTGIDRAHRQK